MEAKDIAWGSGETPGSSAWLKVEGVSRIPSSDRDSDTGVSCLGLEPTGDGTDSWTAECKSTDASVGGIASATGDCIRDAGGEMGNSGRSSRNRDIVRFGTPELTRRGMRMTGGVGVGVVCIESREVLENDEGPTEPRLFLLPHRKKEVQDLWALAVAPESLGACSECSVLISDSCGDFDRDSFLRKEPLDAGIVRVGAASSLRSEGASGGCKGWLSIR